MAQQALVAATPVTRQVIDAATPVAKQAFDAGAPVAKWAIQAARPVGRAAFDAAAPMAKQAMDAAAPLVKQGVNAAMDSGALPAMTRGVAAAAPVLGKGGAVVTKGVISAACAATGEVRTLEERVAELERSLSKCQAMREAEKRRAAAATAYLDDQLKKADAQIQILSVKR